MSPDRRPSRRGRIAAAFDETGITSLMARTPSRGRLVVLNYHRIGDSATSDHYRGVFSATADGFASQVAWLASHYTLVSLEEAVALIDTPAGGWPDRAAVLITFDDGYRDNYDVALPILQEYGARAAFFLATSFIGTGRVPWWDRVAYSVAHAQKRDAGSLNELLRRCKAPGVKDPESIVASIEAEYGVSAPADPDLFMTWEHVAALKHAGMGIGAHTHRHAILSRIDATRQAEEIERSRDAIAAALGGAPTAFAYPEGARDSFDATSRALLASTGFRAAFSYHGGVNTAGRIDRFDVCRLPVVSDLSFALFTLRLTQAAATGRVWL